VQRGAVLAAVESALEQDLLAKLHPDTDAWLGGQDWLDETRFSWLDGTVLDGGYSNWLASQPNNAKKNQHCILQRGDGLWNDVTCKREENYICQKYRI